MAITATAQSALQDLSWDEAIVPTLRKRLEIESRALSKRMSAVSIGEDEDAMLSYGQMEPPRTSASSNRTGGRVTPSSTSTERPSAIPRPSLNYSRPSAGPGNFTASQGSNKGNMKRPGQQRSRTFSQPYAFDVAMGSIANGANGHSNPSMTRTTNALPTPASSRSNSPSMPSPPPSNARGARNTKASGNKRSDPSGRSTPTYNRPMRDDYDDQEEWHVDEDTYDASYSSINVDIPRHVKQNGIMHEAAPFSANSSFASEVEVRPSLEERPYEHWYRGDLSRNGGVGELRVGNRMEMLEIASYGHKLRKIGNDTLLRRRRRAESIGHRESVVFDEEQDNSVPLVLDETPLTDMEAEADTELETDRELSFTGSPPPPLEQSRQTGRTATLSPSSTAAIPPSTPKRRQPSQIPRATPNATRTTQRTASEPLQKPLSSLTPSIPHSRSGPSAHTSSAKISNSQPQAMSTPVQKRGRAKSPAVTPANKKPRPSAAHQKRSKSVGNERLMPREVSEYPEVPDGPGNMADAIPSWTQPKKADNWDDVVLPAVARKMGLKNQYEEADGSPKAQRPPSQEVIPPQPGTFGIDPSKRRQRYDPATGVEIPMNELEEGKLPVKIVNNEVRRSKRFSKMNGPPAISVHDGNRYSPPSSPAPFARYVVADLAKLEPENDLAGQHENRSACCGCIIM